jgi:hypothetical protein
MINEDTPTSHTRPSDGITLLTSRNAAYADVSIVDRGQIEVRLHYPIDGEEERQRYQMDLYLFVPSALGVDAQSHRRSDFYRNLVTYFSFGVPRISVDQIGVGVTKGPLVARILRALAELGPAPAPDSVDRLSGDLRMLGCVVGMLVEKQSDAVVAKIKHLRTWSDALPEGAIQSLRSRTNSMIADARTMMGHVHDLEPAVERGAVPPGVREVYRWVREHLSLLVESEWTRIIAYLDKDPMLAGALGDVRAELARTIVAERSIRTDRALSANVTEDVEYVNYRTKTLEKFVRSVLFLEIARGEDGGKIAETVATIAAGAAMLMSTIIAALAQQVYGVNTMPFIVIVVVAYMLKDRSKEWIKRLALPHLSRFHADYKVSIQDKRSGEIVGRCRELVSFVEAARLPPEVFARRHQDPTNTLEIRSKPESVIRYEKQIELHSARIQSIYSDVNLVEDVIRLKVSDLVQRADDSEQIIRAYRPERDAVEVTPCASTYHLNIVVVQREVQTGTTVVMGKACVVLGKHGARRVLGADVHKARSAGTGPLHVPDDPLTRPIPDSAARA